MELKDGQNTQRNMVPRRGGMSLTSGQPAVAPALTDHGEDVRVIMRARILVLLHALLVERGGARDPEVGAENVHEYRSANVYRLRT